MSINEIQKEQLNKEINKIIDEITPKNRTGFLFLMQQRPNKKFPVFIWSKYIFQFKRQGWSRNK